MRSKITPRAKGKPAISVGSPFLSLEHAIGVQVRQLRHRTGITVTELAAAANLSVGMLSKIENGQISASLGSLQALAGALNVPITIFFSAFEEKRDCCFVKAGTAMTVERRGSKAGHEYGLLGRTIGSASPVEPYLITLDDNASSYTVFQHPGTEFIYMLSGEVVYRHGEKSFHLTPGDSLLFDSDAPHGPEEFLVKPIRFISIITRAGE